jgi:hypothetical protein
LKESQQTSSIVDYINDLWLWHYTCAACQWNVIFEYHRKYICPTCGKKSTIITRPTLGKIKQETIDNAEMVSVVFPEIMDYISWFDQFWVHIKKVRWRRASDIFLQPKHGILKETFHYYNNKRWPTQRHVEWRDMYDLVLSWGIDYGYKVPKPQREFFYYKEIKNKTMMKMNDILYASYIEYWSLQYKNIFDLDDDQKRRYMYWKNIWWTIDLCDTFLSQKIIRYEDYKTILEWSKDLVTKPSPRKRSITFNDLPSWLTCGDLQYEI